MIINRIGLPCSALIPLNRPHHRSTEGAIHMAEESSHSSMFSDAHNFNTHGGLFNSAARDLHVHYYHHTGQGNDSQQQLGTASTPPPILPTRNVDEERSGVASGSPLLGDPIPFYSTDAEQVALIPRFGLGSPFWIDGSERNFWKRKLSILWKRNTPLS